MADRRLFVRQRENQRFEGHRVANLAQGQGRRPAHIAVRVSQVRDKRRRYARGR